MAEDVKCPHCSRMPFQGHHASCPNNEANVLAAKKAKVSAAMTAMAESIKVNAAAFAATSELSDEMKLRLELAYVAGAGATIAMFGDLLKEAL